MWQMTTEGEEDVCWNVLRGRDVGPPCSRIGGQGGCEMTCYTVTSILSVGMNSANHIRSEALSVIGDR